MALTDGSISTGTTANQSNSVPSSHTEKPSSASISTSIPSAHVVSPLNIVAHIRRLFIARDTSAGFPALDGVRAILCIWMVAFHSVFFSENFSEENQHVALQRHPALTIITFGFLPVDGFFVLTGFLLAYPLFSNEIKQQKLKKQDGQLESTQTNNNGSATSHFSLQSWYYRRFIRMLPSYFLSLFLYCGLLFPHSQHALSLIRNRGFLALMNRILPSGTTEVPSQCDNGMVIANVLFVNNLVPFGGCMGWTWSFAVQVQFYLFFPLLWKLILKYQSQISLTFNRKLLAATIMVHILHVIFFISIVTRFLAYFQLRSFPLVHENGIFLSFWWYSATFTRISTIIIGVYVAYFSTVSIDVVEKLKQSAVWRHILFGICVSVLLIQFNYNRFLPGFRVIEPPGYSALQASQSASPVYWPNVWKDITHVLPHLHHFLYYSFVIVGSPLSGFMFAYMIFITLHRVGAVGEICHQLCSKSIFYSISVLSWFVYLLHPAVMIKFYVEWTKHYPNWEVNVQSYFFHTACIYGITFTLALLCHVLFEQPIEILLRSSERLKSQQSTVKRLTTIIFIYVIVLMVVSVIAHSAATVVLMWTSERTEGKES